MPKLTQSKGFTLIELLVVIAILGILAAVVLIAINPAERLRESRDTQVRSDIAQLAQAAEGCYTQDADGVYDDCDTAQDFIDKGYLKSDVQTSWTPVLSADGREIIIYAEIEASAAKREAGCSDDPDDAAYYAYNSADNSSEVYCAVPTF